MRRTLIAIALLACACGTEDDAPNPECYVWESELVCTDGDCVEHHLCLPCEGTMVPDSDDRGRPIHACLISITEPLVQCTLTCEEGPPEED